MKPTLTTPHFGWACFACLLSTLSLPLVGCDSGNGDNSGGAGGTGGLGAPGMGGYTGGMTSGCTPAKLETSGTLYGQWGKTNLTVGGKDYFLRVNEWGSTGNQTMEYGGDFFFKMTVQQATGDTAGAPAGFPSVFIGANSGDATTGSNLPIAISAITSVPTTWIWKDNGTLADESTNVFNAAYDVWFSTSADGDPGASSPSGGFLMVWLYDPQNAQPIGALRNAGVAIPGVDGTWDIWVGRNGTLPCISYVRRPRTLSMSYDLNVFIQDAVKNRTGSIDPSWYLSSVFIGFEIWKGSAGIETTSFCAEVIGG